MGFNIKSYFYSFCSYFLDGVNKQVEVSGIVGNDNCVGMGVGQEE